MAVLCVRLGVSSKPKVTINGTEVSASNVTYDSASRAAYVVVPDEGSKVLFDGVAGEYYTVLGNAPSNVLNVQASQGGNNSGGSSGSAQSGKGLFGAPVVSIAGQPVDVGSVLAGAVIGKMIA